MHDPCNIELFKFFIEFIKRICCHSLGYPVTPCLILILYKTLGGATMKLLNLRTILLWVLSFLGFLRFSEVNNLNCSQISLK